MNKDRCLSYLFLIIIGLSLPYLASSQQETDDASPIEMTTSESILTVQNAKGNCSSYETCEDCVKGKCFWLLCIGSEYSCDNEPNEECPYVECSNVTTIAPTTTVSPNDTTTPPTTTETPTTTTDNSTTTTSPTTTTTTSPNTTTSTTTTTPSPNSTTSSTTTTAASTTTTEAPHQRHFDAGSFVGGMILTLTLTAVAFAGWKFYRRRALATSYTNF